MVSITLSTLPVQPVLFLKVSCIEQRDIPNWGLVAMHYGDKIPDWGL
jgi:hypothetical protein